MIDAFNSPCFTYDPVHKLFHTNCKHSTLYSDATSKVDVYTRRYHLISQRIRRHKLFRPSVWGSSAADGSNNTDCELTELKALLGLVGQPRYVLGFLTQPEENRYFIEDLSARLPCDLTEAEQAGGLFTENCIVVVEGELTPAGIFKVSALGLPPPERRADSLTALQGLDLFGGRIPEAREVAAFRAHHPDDRVIFLSDVWLDRPDVLDKLNTVLSIFASMPQPPSMFVLMGDFQSCNNNTNSASITNYSRIKEGFAALGILLSRHKTLMVDHGCQFVIVPGPSDLSPSSGCLPKAAIPRSIAAPLLDVVPSPDNIILTSNPCRIRHGDKELVVFREQMQRRFNRLALLPPVGPSTPQAGAGDHDDDDNDDDDDVHITTKTNANTSSSIEESQHSFDSLCSTVLQEGHLMPLPLEYAPVHWEWDHALSVYPAPDGLVLSEGLPAATHVFDRCACMNPGSLVEGTFGAYIPATGEMELCDVCMPDDDDDGGGEEEEEDGARKLTPEEAMW